MKLKVLLGKLGVPVEGIPTAELDREVDVVIGNHHFDVFQVTTKAAGPIRLELNTAAASTVDPLWPDDRS